MDGYNIANLGDMITTIGEEAVKSLLSDFSCPLNADVERFLKQSSIEFAKQSIAITYLVFVQYKGQPVIAGYFTIANKAFKVRVTELSKSWRKRLGKFKLERIDNSYIISSPLIAQLGKNHNYSKFGLISGDVLLHFAIDKVAEAQRILGGKIVYLECEDIDKVVGFYSKHGFVNFGKRELDKDEQEMFPGKYLIQMLRYL